MSDRFSTAAAALGLIEKLRAAGVDLSGNPVAPHDVLEPGSVDFGDHRSIDPDPATPVVFCLMVTRGDTDLFRFSAQYGGGPGARC